MRGVAKGSSFTTETLFESRRADSSFFVVLLTA
jgi:hypothetical protein